MKQLHVADFADKVGQLFQLVHAQETVDLRLSKAEPGQNTRPGSGRESFSLYFTTVQPVFLDQAIHLLRHPEMGEVQIFLTPIGRNEDGTFNYQAVFN